MRWKTRVWVVIGGMLLFAATWAWAQSSSHYALSGANINSGGSAAIVSAQYSACTTVGQSSPIGVSRSGNYTLSAGVQYIFAASTPPAAQNSYILWTK